ncbi:MAG: hypothetical protein KDB27_36190 [Planctomycetales bacterium]|nr:hypothetical protein [Planctomycetales bacterium]
MKVVVGCDGGGTKCHVRVAIIEGNSVQRFADAITGPANFKADANLAIENIKTAIQCASEAAGVEDESIDILVAALAGTGLREAQAACENRLSAELNVARVVVVPDAAVLFAAANIQGMAIATVIGTGSIAWARDARGNVHRAGGLGPDIGDEGSGFWIGRECIRNLKDHALGELVEQHVPGLEDDESSYALPENRHRVAAFAAVAFCIQEPNKLFESILNRAANHIADLIQTAVAEMGPSEISPIPWICAGGVAVNQPRWIESIRQICHNHEVLLTQPTTVRDPVRGAVAMAIDLLH